MLLAANNINATINKGIRYIPLSNKAAIQTDAVDRAISLLLVSITIKLAAIDAIVKSINT